MGEPYWADETVTLYLGKCEDVLPGLPANSVDAIVTDPPYDLTAGKKGGTGGGGFMGKSWDATGVAFDPATWRAALRVLKPGGYLLAFGGTRTWHRMVCAIEDAGFEIRDSVASLTGQDAPGLMWMHSQGFPKSRDIGKDIDRMRNDRPDILRVTSWLADVAETRGISRAQVDAHMDTSDMGGWWLSRLAHRCAVPTWEQWQRLRDLIGFGGEMDDEVWRLNGRKGTPGEAWNQREITQPGKGQHTPGDVIGWDQRSSKERERRDVATTEDAARWDGWGTALKPAWEPVVVARKPLAAGSVAANVLEWGTGALNINACKVAHASEADLATSLSKNPGRSDTVTSGTYGAGRPQQSVDTAGRWPTNLVLTHDARCEPAGTRRVRGDSRSGQEPGSRPGGFGDVGAERGSERPNGALYGDQVVEVWSCVDSCPVAELDRQSGVLTSGSRKAGTYGLMGYMGADAAPMPAVNGDTGGASRFYPVFRYQAKAPASERPRLDDGSAHETVKPLELIRWLCRLVVPPGGTVLDMFAGSGPVGEAAIIEGFRCVLIEQDPKSAELIKTRLSKPIQPTLFGLGEASLPPQSSRPA